VPVCVSELTFARASPDCLGIAGQSTMQTTDGGGPTVNDAGGSDAPTGG
jgi:hypothetical protein